MIPIVIFLIPYGLFLFAFLFFSFVNVYHIIHFGRATGIVGFFSVCIYLAVAMLLLIATWSATNAIDWSTPVDVFSSFVPPSFAPEAP